MSRVLNLATGRWTTDRPFFAEKFIQYGPLSQRQGRAFGASCASAILGPDLYGAPHFNIPTAVGPPWDQLFPAPPAPPIVLPPPPNAVFAPATGPAVTFTQDALHTWIRGHLINSAWNGTGS